jgi:hypothetical protein
MNDIIYKNNIKGPINILFPRSDKVKKKDFIDYNMSGLVPKIKVETENSSRPTVEIKNPINVSGIDIIKDNDSDSNSSGSTIEPTRQQHKKISNKTSFKSNSSSKFDAEDYQNFVNNSKTKNRNPNIEESDEYSDEDSISDEYSDDSRSDVSSDKGRKNSKQEKQEILLKLLALEKKGVELTKKYSMTSKLSDLKFELKLHQNNTEIELSVKFQQKILMAAVTGLEFANSRFDPIGAKLDGWGESVMENLDDYESVFMKLHEKYKNRADLPAELQLFVTLVGSAFMFHVTKTLFSSALPKGLNDTQSSDIMKNIAAAMANNKTQPISNPNKLETSYKDISGPSFNLSKMLNKEDSESESSGSIETSKEVTVNEKGKRAINL